MLGGIDGTEATRTEPAVEPVPPNHILAGLLILNNTVAAHVIALEFAILDFAKPHIGSHFGQIAVDTMRMDMRAPNLIDLVVQLRECNNWIKNPLDIANNMWLPTLSQYHGGQKFAKGNKDDMYKNPYHMYMWRGMFIEFFNAFGITNCDPPSPIDKPTSPRECIDWAIHTKYLVHGPTMQASESLLYSITAP